MGIITLISVFTPAIYFDEIAITEYYWMWGLYYNYILGYGSNTLLIPLEQPSKYMIPIFLSGIFSALIIFLCSLALIASANKVRLGKKDPKDVSNSWIGLGIVLIFSSISYIIATGITMNNYVEYVFSQLPYYYTVPDIWDVYNPGFGIFGPFIGAASSIIIGIASKKIKPREVVQKVEESKLPIIYPQTDEISNNFHYCPECGQKILYKEGKFCRYCGFEFKF